jgi:hypothetical protein
MGTTKLALWNSALQDLGSERLSDTGDPVKAARELTAVYDKVVATCVASGSWNFAMETVQLDADTGVTPSFGFTEVFAKPSDWVRTIAVSLDEYFAYPLTQYYDDDSFWSADNTPIYARYVSNDTGLGLDLSRWPENFSRYVELELAHRVCMALTQNAGLRREIGEERDQARKVAKNIDAMNEAQPKFPPPGSWTQARWGRSAGRDRGSRGRLTG